ncbi:MAG: DNA-binding transcriptional regulator [Planctomycetaceae bacterium]|jgi:LacI family transcriptional regulator|nr:DNA-binding transcriptional regulator [Planctomycetaceae bacterium]
MKRKKNVLLIVETSRAFGRGLLQGISHHILEHDDWSVHVEDRGLLESTPTWLQNWKGDGIISRTSSFAVARTLRRLRIPLVELLGNGQQIVPEIRSDEDEVARSVVDHFVQSGFADFGFFAIGNAWWSQLRLEAWTREVQKQNGQIHVFPQAGKGHRVFYPVWEPKFDTRMQRWLRYLPKPIAVWAVSDALAIRLLEGCRRVGIQVPGEVAILGTTNDTLLCNILTPPLSSVDLNGFQIGYAAAERLSRKMNGETVPKPPVLIPPVGVIARQSTDVVALPDKEIIIAIRFLRENAARNISVDQIAEAAGISRSTLQRRFRQKLGRSVEKEIMRTRMDRAKRLLRETRFALSAIAAKTGFATNDYFVQAFRRECGMTPHQYRQQIQSVIIND